MKLSIKLIVLLVLMGTWVSNAADAGSLVGDVGKSLFCQEDTEESNQTLDTEKKLGFTYDLTYHTKWMSKGYSVYGEQGAWMNTMLVDLWQSGFGVAFRYDMASASGHVKRERMDYTIFYGEDFFEDGICKTRCKISWTYRDYLREHDKKINSHEFQASMCLPKVFGDTVFPKYVISYCTPAGSGYDIRGAAGWVHSMGLCYDLKIAALSNQKVVLDAMATYNDGFGGKGHGWSHATMGATTRWEINKNVSFVPGIYYQVSMNNMDIDLDDTLYAKFSFRYKF